MSEIDNTKVKKIKEFNIAMPIYDLLEYSQTYPKNIIQFMAKF